MSRQVAAHRPSTVAKAWRRRNLSLCACIAFVVCSVYPVSCQDQRLATFYGAYQRIKPSTSTTGLNVALNFKTSSPDGLLLAVRLDSTPRNNAGYLGIGFTDRHLITLLSDNLNSVNKTSTDFPLQRDIWYSLSLRMINTSINVDLSNGSDFSFSSSLTLSAPLDVRDMFLGGANSFFSRAFTTLEITEYYVGCLANLTVNGRLTNFAPKLEGYGMQDGCCPNPEPIVWNFLPGEQNSLVFDSRLVHSRFQTNTLVLSFLIQSEQDGMIFYSHDEHLEFALAVELQNGQILIHLSNEVQILNAYFLACDRTIIDGWRHNVKISIQPDSLRCVVDGHEASLNVTLSHLPTDSLEYHVGSANVSTSSTTLHVFQGHLRTVATDGMFPSFGGSLQKFQLNGLEVSPSVLPSNPPRLSPPCPQVVDIPSICQPLQDVSLLDLAEVSVTPETVQLDENATEILTDQNMILRVPVSIFQMGAQESVRDSIRLSVASYPSHGVLVNISSPREQVREFSYSQLMSGSVAYRHNGEEESSDSFLVDVTSICTPAIKMSITINVSVTLTNDLPVVTQLGTLAIAVGTRRVIPPDVISVEDEESPSLISISFTVKSILVDGCGTCGAAGRVERTSSPGVSSIHFNQKEINNGEVLFQHFREFGMEPLTISLMVSDSVGVSVAVEIPVVPYTGNVTLVLNEPLFLVEGRCSYVTAQHLRADTNFNDQNPILQYRVTSAPMHGRLEVMDQGHWRPALGPNVDFQGFTQENVNQNHVRYCHDNNSLATDTFEFELHSTLLPGGSDSFSIHVSAYAALPKPNISLTVAPAYLLEGGQVSLSEDTLAVSLDQHVTLPWSQEMLQIESLGLFFRLEGLPSFGKVYVDGEILTETNFSLAQLVRGVTEYHHDNSENHHDHLQVRVEALNAENLPIQRPNLPPLTNLSIIISPVNDHTPTVQTSRITVAEGRYITLTPRVLNITDEDLPRENITITVLNQNFDHGFFAHSDSATPITEFMTSDVSEETLYFHHKLNTSLPLIHTVTIQVSDGELSSQKEVEIEAQPLVIDTSKVNFQQCIAQLDAVSDSLSTHVLPDSFRAVEIYDEHGTDLNRLQSMSLRVLQQPMHGDLLLGSANAVVFTMNDLTNRLVTYRLRNRTNRVSTDNVTIEVGYGHSDPADLVLKICIVPVPAPDLEQVVLKRIKLTTPFPLVLIDNETFQAEDTRGDGGEAIIYSVVLPPRWGMVVDQNGTNLTNFTQEDIDQGLVSYSHTNHSSSTLQDYFILTLCTLYVCEGRFNITVVFSVTNLTVFNNELVVEENGEAVINRNNLDAIAPEGVVTFHIVKPPRRGRLFRNVGGIVYPDPQFFDARNIANGAVSYRHDGSETIADSFTFTVTTANSGERITDDVFRIRITPVNDNIPRLIRKRFSMIARTTRNITSQDLEAYDGDNDINSVQLRYKITYGPLLGNIHYRNSSTPIKEWLEDDVVNNRLAYTHTNQDRLQGETPELIVVQLHDQDRFESYIIQIYINEIQITVTQEPARVSEGGDITINDMFLAASADGDESLTGSDLKFNITSPPRHGRITLNRKEVTNFTQADLSGPGLVYQHDHSNTISDSFNYTVTVMHHRASEQGIFLINIDPVDDDPPELIFHQQPLFVVEGDSINIVRDHLEVIDFDTDMSLVSQTNEIEFRIITQPRHGDILRRQGGSTDVFLKTEVFTLYEVNYHSVKYRSHPIDERSEYINWFDWFLVNLTDSENAHETPYNFTFVILPNIVSVKGTAFQVEEGGETTVPPDTIVALHPYLGTQCGFIIINEQPSNGTFVNVMTGEENIANFTTDDLRAGSIRYCHNDAEKDQDRVRFTYEAHRPIDPESQTQPGRFPEGFMRTSDVVTLDIFIITKNDRGPEIRSGNDSTLVMWAEDCAFLSVRHLDVVDPDTPNNKLTYTFNFTSIDAYISHINDSNSIQINTFTQEDVVNSLIKLFHRSGETGIMHYTVTDGDFSASGQLLIETHRLEIVVLKNIPLSVPMNGMVAITSKDLDVGTSDVNTSISQCFFNEAVEYQFEAKYGTIVANGMTNATSFTDEDVKSGQVFYQHTKPEIWESHETLKLKAKALLTNVKEFDFYITIDLPSEPDSPLAVHRTLAVIEGEFACLNESILDARNIRYNATLRGVNQTLTSWFVFNYSENSHGEILLDGKRPPDNPPRVSQDQIASGSVCYHNFGDESTDDFLEFSVLIEDSDFLWGSALGLVLNVSVTLINDEAPTVVSSTLSIPVVEGFSAPVTNDSLLVVDEDNPSSDLMFSILTLPPGGHLLLDGKLLKKYEKFSQEMVNEGRLGFGAQDIGEWTAQLSFTDGGFNNSTNFTVFIEEHLVKVVETKTLRYSQNENGAHLTLEHIVTETNGESNETVYFLVEPPVNGELKGLREGQFFTQSDLAAKKVLYVPIDFKTHSDSFKINVRNREAENSTVTIEVKVDVWGEVKQNVELNFYSTDKGELSLPLPKNILQLSDLQFLMERPPIISIIQQPKLGFLEVKVSATSRKRRAASPTPSDKFSYNFLEYDWVYYTWNASNATFENPSEGVYDFFYILVEGYEGIQPGEANITLHIRNPPLPADYQPPSTESPSPSDSPTVYKVFIEDPGDGGFPMYALIPILGVFIILLLIISVVIVFCITQQGRIRKHLQPKMPRHQPLARPQVNGLQLQPSNIYGMESSAVGHREAMTSFDDMSAYRDSHSPVSRHSPLTHYSPLASHPHSSAMFSERYHHRHMIPRPRSRRSNVSVSYSHRPLSEVTLDELPPRSRHHTFSPPLMGAPNPLRPATRCSSVYEAGEEESGYLSTPNPSIAPDEPVRLVLRRPAVEEVSPLPRDVGGDRDEVEEEEEEVGEESFRQQEETAGGVAENTEEREASCEPAVVSTDHQSTTPPPSADQETISVQDEEMENLADDNNIVHHSNGAHAVGTPPSDPNLPLLPESRPVSSAASAASAAGGSTHGPTPSDLQTLFRTHNPILKHAEYWV